MHAGSGNTEPSGTREDLDAFVSRLSDADAAGLRAVAGQIDAAERGVQHLRDVETRHRGWALLAMLLFAAGAWLVLFPGHLSAWLLATLGPLPLLIMVGGLGMLGLAYGYVVRERLRADEIQMALNRAHFVPLEVYYFPAVPAEGQAGYVVHFKPRKVTARPLGPHDRVQPGRSWW